MNTLEVDARPASVHTMAHDGATPSGLTGMDALLQRMVVYEATVPPGAIEGQRVHPYMQPHIRLTLPAGAIPGTVAKWVNMETVVPASWEPGVQLMTTLRSGTRVQIVPSSDASAGQSVEFSVPFVLLTDEFRSQLHELEALQRALAASPDNTALLGQLANLESLVQRSLAAQLRPPSPPPPVSVPVPVLAPMPSGAGLDQAALHTAVEAAVEAAVRRSFDSAAGGWVESARLELREIAAQLQGEAKAELSSSLELWLTKLLEAQQQAQQAQQVQQQAQLQAWLEQATRTLQQAACCSVHGQLAAAPPPPVLSAAALLAAPPAATPPPAAPASLPSVETAAVGCQAGMYSEATAAPTTPLKSSTPPRPSRPASSPTARIVSASAHLSSRRVDIPRAADWRWYHQVHAEPPGPLGGNYMH